jgi:hypothetical protein
LVRLARVPARHCIQLVQSWDTNEKIVQRVLRHAKPHTAKDCYIKTFDRGRCWKAMQRMQAIVDSLGRQWPAVVQQQN